MRHDGFNLLYLAGFIIDAAVRWRYAHGRRDDPVESRHVSAADTVLVSLCGLGFAAPLIYLFTGGWPGIAGYTRPLWAGWTGAALLIAAVWMLWRSHVDLGHNWSPVPTIKQGQQLVTGGVYARIRHPMYAAHWLWAAAQALLIANWIAGPLFAVVLLPFYIVRVPREERMMIERFGDRYRDYMRRTGRVIPRLGGDGPSQSAGAEPDASPAAGPDVPSGGDPDA